MSPLDFVVTNPWIWLVLAAGVLMAFVSFFAQRYYKAGPNQVLIVSGRRGTYHTPDGTIKKNFRIYHGGGTFVWPLRERIDRLSLELMTLEIKTPEFYTKFGVPIVVDGIAQIKVRSDDPVAVMTAAEMFLSKSREEMNEIALQMMSGHLRAVISTLPFEEIHANPEAFAQAVQRLTAEDLANMGIQVVSFTIREIRDPQGYIEAIKRPKMAEVQKNAVLGEADAGRDSTMGKALAEREATVTASKANQEAQMAKIAADLAVAESEKNKDIQLNRFRAENATAKAESDLAYELQQAKCQQRLSEEKLGVNLVEKNKQIEVEQSEIERRELELVHTVKKPADAERYKVETLAQAEQRRRTAQAEAEANAARLKGLADAEIIRAKGDAEAEALRQRTLAEAEGLKAKCLAEAEGLKAKILAEAEGMQEKAEAWKQYNEAAVAQMFIEKLPDIAAAVAAPLSKIDRIVLVNNGNGSAEGTGIDRITKGVTDVLAQVPAVAELLTGVNLPDLVRRVPGLQRNGAQDDSSVQVTDVPADGDSASGGEPKRNVAKPSAKTPVVTSR
jgi:flotillin